jgi:hypothetical protein
MAVKTKVDVVIFEYSNENGGLMGMVLQLPKNDGKRLQQWLSRFDIKVEEPSSPSQPLAEPQIQSHEKKGNQYE